MCPVCLTTAAAIAVGTGTVTGLAALVLGKRRAEPHPQAPNTVPQSEEK
jgi:hypothetical protein